MSGEERARVPTNSEVLISGASVAGPTLAYWLHRHGFRPTVVERQPLARMGSGGHAVDLFGPAVDVAEWMGILPAVRAARTRTDLISFQRPGKRSIEVDLRRLVAGISDRHVEVMRGELAAVLHRACDDDVEYIFGDSISAIDEDDDGVDVSFDHGAARRFDLVVGADGLHSNVRRLAFGDESRFRRYVGGYLGIFTLPNYLGLDGRVLTYNAPGRVAAIYPIRQTGTARAGFLVRRDAQFAYDHRDVDEQKRVLREAFADDGWELPRLLAELDDAEDFYFDSISQIVMDTWSRGRVTLAGDAGYSPGPAVGGGTSVAVVGAYILAGELADAGGEHTTAWRNYENKMREFVGRCRTIGPTTMKSLIPRTPLQVWLTPHLMRLVPRLPARVQQRLSSLQGGPARALEAITLKRYESIR
jgi:2-polyprenyl-6-methoxyphenol hydroxylase-like FAD-dependent oxidoreductase